MRPVGGENFLPLTGDFINFQRSAPFLMDSSKLAIKLFVKDGSAVDAHSIVPVFHRWIQTHALPNHMLIDVADYRHVQSGPGIVLISHEANLSLDADQGRVGLLYARKTPIEGSFEAKLRETFASAIFAASLLENEPSLEGRIRFRTDEVSFRINDRLFAPNTAETFNAIAPALEAFCKKLYGAPVQLTHVQNEELLFEVAIHAGVSPSLADLAHRL
jgi:hypothetical protein